MKKTIIIFLLLFSTVFLSIVIYVPSVRAYQDFENEYTEVDTANDRIQCSTVHIDHKATRNEDTYVYKNFSANFFGDFEHDLDVRSDFAQNNAFGYVWVLANVIDDCQALRTGTVIEIFFYISSVGVKSIFLREWFSSLHYDDYFVNALTNTWYFLNIKKSGTSLKCGIYSTSTLRNNGNASDGDIDNLSLTLQADHKFSILYGCNSLNDGNIYYLNTDVENLSIKKWSVTFYLNEGGQFRVNNEIITNDTMKKYSNGTIIELVGITKNSSYTFKSFNWTGGSTTNNPHNYTVTSNITIWLFFGDAEGIPTPYIFARFTFNMSNPELNENIFFNGSYSVSSSAITSYEWTFGDGNTDSGATVTHSYSTENTFSITLNVTSSDGSDTFTLNLTVAEAQVAEEEGSSGGFYSLLVHVTWNQVPCFANVTVQNSQGNDSTTIQTDMLGNAKFNLPMGIYFVSTCYRNHTLEETVHLNENSFVSFNFKVKGGPTWIALLAVIIVLIIGYAWIGKKKKTRHKATLEPRSHKPTTKPRKHKDNVKPRPQKR